MYQATLHDTQSEVCTYQDHGAPITLTPLSPATQGLIEPAPRLQVIKIMSAKKPIYQPVLGSLNIIELLTCLPLRVN